MILLVALSWIKYMILLCLCIVATTLRAGLAVIGQKSPNEPTESNVINVKASESDCKLETAFDEISRDRLVHLEIQQCIIDFLSVTLLAQLRRRSLKDEGAGYVKLAFDVPVEKLDEKGKKRHKRRMGEMCVVG